MNTIKIIIATCLTALAGTLAIKAQDYPIGDPIPGAFEDFESVAEGQLPAGWTVENFTDDAGAPGVLDVANIQSDTYKDWTVLARSTLTSLSLNSARRLNVAEGQFVNGEEVTVLLEGNFIYAESDVRGGSQIQFLFTKDFDCSGQNDVYVGFNSAYEQNQDSIGALEYSIDGGNSWLPVLYMIDSGDIIRDETTGEVLGLETMDEPRGDTANAATIGGSYGEFLGVDYFAVDVGPFIQGRVDDGQFESKRVELHRLPEADGESTVRLRFAYAGTSSWYWGVDNVGLYSIAASAPAFTLQPVGVEVTEGETVTLSVSVSSADAVSYQWSKDGTEIPDATGAVLEVFGATLDDAGSYTVTASSASGSATSDAANVVVNPDTSGGPAAYFAETFDRETTESLITKGWDLGKNEFATEVGTEFAVVPPYPVRPPGSSTGFVNPPGADGTESLGKYLISDSDAASGSDDVGTKSEFWATTPSFSTEGSAEAWFHADAEIENNNNGECVVDLRASIDGGQTWIPLWQTAEPDRPIKSFNIWNSGIEPDFENGDDIIGGYPVAGSASQTKSFSGIHGRWHLKLPAEANNQPDVRLQIRYYEPADAWWIALDNILVDENPPPMGEEVVLFEDFEDGIPGEWNLVAERTQVWSSEPLKDEFGDWVKQGFDGPITVDLLDAAEDARAAGFDIPEEAFLRLSVDDFFDFPDLETLHPRGFGLSGRMIMMLAGGGYAMWQESIEDIDETLGPEASDLDTPILDLSAASEVYLDFDSEVLVGNPSSVYDVLVSVDGGDTFERIWTYTGALMNYEEASYFTHHYLDVSQAAGMSQVIFRFHAEGQDPGEIEGWWVIDNVRVTSDDEGTIGGPGGVVVPATAKVGPPPSVDGTGLNGRYWQLDPKSITGIGGEDGAINIINSVPPDATFMATSINYEGNDLSRIGSFLGSDGESLSVEEPGNMDDGLLSITGFISISEPGNVQFISVSDDGSIVSVGGVEVLNNDGFHSETGGNPSDETVNFEEAGLYPIEINYFNGDWTNDAGEHGAASLRLSSNGAGGIGSPGQIIPVSVFYQEIPTVIPTEEPEFDLSAPLLTSGDRSVQRAVLAVNTQEPEALLVSIDPAPPAGTMDPISGGDAIQAVFGQFYNTETLEPSGDPFVVLGNPFGDGGFDTPEIDYNEFSGQYVVVASAKGYSDFDMQIPIIALVNPKSVAGDDDPVAHAFAFDNETDQNYDDTAIAASSQNGNIALVAERKFEEEGEGVVGALFDKDGNVLTTDLTRLDRIGQTGDEDDPDVVYLPGQDTFFFITNTDGEPNSAGNRVTGSVILTEAGGDGLLQLGNQGVIAADRKEGVSEGHPHVVESPFANELVGAFDYDNGAQGGDISYARIGNAPNYNISVVRDPIPYVDSVGSDPYNSRHPQLAVDPGRGVFALFANAHSSASGLPNGMGLTLMGPDGVILPGIPDGELFHAFIETKDPETEEATQVGNDPSNYDIKFDPNSGSFLATYADSSGRAYLVRLSVTSDHGPPTGDISEITGVSLTAEGNIIIEGTGTVGRSPTVDGTFEGSDALPLTVTPDQASEFFKANNP